MQLAFTGSFIPLLVDPILSNTAPLWVYLPLGLIAGTIGALPFGLVNLRVLNTALNVSLKKAALLSHGAALTEIMFVLLSVFLGKHVAGAIQNSTIAHAFIIGLLLAAAAYFFVQKPKKKTSNILGKHFYLKGIGLNLISLQVLFYWFVVMAILNTNRLSIQNMNQLILFTMGVYAAKILVLWTYAQFGKHILGNSKVIAQNMNRITALFLLLIAFFQSLNYL